MRTGGFTGEMHPESVRWLKGVGGRVWKLTQVDGVVTIGKRATGSPHSNEKHQVRRPFAHIGPLN